MKRRTKALSVILVLAFLLTNVFAISAKAATLSDTLDTAERSFESGGNVRIQDELVRLRPSDPLEFMRDIPKSSGAMPNELWELYFNADNSELREEIMREIELRTIEQQENLIDRYIVRYSPGQRQNFQSKLSPQIAHSETISVFTESAISAEISGESLDFDSNGGRTQLRTAEWEVITLNEKMLPSEFAEMIRDSGAVRDVEYIQPDYKLSLAGMELDLILIPLGGAGDNNIEELEESDENDEKEKSAEDEADNEPAIDDDEKEESEEDEKDDESADEENEDIDEDCNIEKDPVVVAVIDTGVDIYHPDLIGYIDTENMWDFANNTAEIYDPQKPLESIHGTHIAGIIANTLRKNDINSVQILPLKAFNNGMAYTSDIIAAIEHAILHGATIINCSFGSTQENPLLEEVIANANALFVCAVGNNRRDFTEIPSYPAGYDLPNIISVASVNADGGLSYFSNYGENIDITALGRNVWNAFPENNHGASTGTSMSAAYVTAAAAIVSANEDLTAEELRHRLLETADRLSNLQNQVSNGRRVNLVNAVNNVASTGFIQNQPEDDFDTHGYQMNRDELWDLYSTNVTLIYTAQQLNAVHNNLNSSYKLMNDINLSGMNWIPTGTFRGI
jgi:subtilisin family serine protease